MTRINLPGKGKKVGILGVPIGFGAGKRGAGLGVDAIRMSRVRGLKFTDHLQSLGYQVEDFGNVQVTKPNYEAKPEDNPKYIDEMIISSQNSAERVKDVLRTGATPIILGGDHSIAIGTFSGVSSFYREIGHEVGLIWFDAHSDINTPESSTSGNIHGMPLAHLLGKGNKNLVDLEGFSPKLNPKYFAHIGGRDIDPGERENIYDMGLRDNFFTMSEIDRLGMHECVSRAIEIVSKAPGGYAVTFDVDMLDPRFAPGSGTLVRGGTTYREAHLALEMIAAEGGMRSFEIVEVNPLIDRSNITVELAGELILSVFGKTIL